MKQIVNFLYRDGDNYKFPFVRVVEVKEPLKPEDEVDYEHLGIGRDEFHEEIVGYPYDDQSDHSLLEVVDVMPADDGTPIDLVYLP